MASQWTALPKVATLVRKLQTDVRCYQRDDATTPYKVTENVKVSPRALSREAPERRRCCTIRVLDRRSFRGEIENSTEQG